VDRHLIADLRRGFASYWSLVLILVIDVTLNVALRVIRARRRAADPDAPSPTHEPASRHAPRRER
jgi:hypothetical protein